MHSFSVTGVLFSALLTAWYVAATPDPSAAPTVVLHGVAIVPDVLGLPHFVDATPADADVRVDREHASNIPSQTVTPKLTEAVTPRSP